MSAQHSNHNIGHRYVTTSRPRLGFLEPDAARSGFLKGVPYPQHAAIEIDVAPLKRQNFAAPQTAEQRQQHDGLDLVAFDLFQKYGQLGFADDLNFRRVDLWQTLATNRCVFDDEVEPLRLLEHPSQQAVSVAY